jgi:hypothetical protein
MSFESDLDTARLEGALLRVQAQNAPLSKIAEHRAGASVNYVRALAEAYALVAGSLTGKTSVDVSTK